MSDIYTLKNDRIAVAISALGAEMQSIRIPDETEYLWQGDPTYWEDRAINLFPYVGRLTGGQYFVNAKLYNMPIHGFARFSRMSAEDISGQGITFCLKSSAETLDLYPYDFAYRVRYQLTENRILITYEVRNEGRAAMHFGLGGHPGFNVPLTQGLGFSDYYLEFSQESSPVREGFSEACFVNGEDEPFALANGRYLSLDHGLFDHDAIILKHMDRTVTLKSKRDSKAVTVCYPQMEYLGIWHKPNSDAPYLCIEPWASLPSRQDVVEDIEQQPGLIRLEAGEAYTNSWSIEID